MMADGLQTTEQIHAQIRMLISEELSEFRAAWDVLLARVASIEAKNGIAPIGIGGSDMRKPHESVDSEVNTPFAVDPEPSPHVPAVAWAKPAPKEALLEVEACASQRDSSLPELSRVNTGGRSENWEFEDDSFTIGVIALTQTGLPSAIPALFLALLTPMLQTICFLAIFGLMVTEDFVPNLDAERILIAIVCFFLMCLKLVNEMVQGYHKMAFCCRCFSGMYLNVNPLASSLGILLGFMQLAIPCFIVGLSMQLALGADSVLDQLMNYVALIFITEIDNDISGCHPVKQVFGTEASVNVETSAFGATSSQQQPWLPSMILVVNLGLSFVQLFNFTCHVIGKFPRVSEASWWLEQVPAFLVLVIVLNMVMWFGSRKLGAVKVGVPLSFACATMLFVVFVLHLTMVVNWSQPLLVWCLFCFGIVAPPACMAATSDPFGVLHSPRYLPALAFLILVDAVLWTWHFNIFGYA